MIGSSGTSALAQEQLHVFVPFEGGLAKAQAVHQVYVRQPSVSWSVVDKPWPKDPDAGFAVSVTG